MSVSEPQATDSCSSLFGLSYFIQASCFDCHSHLSAVCTDIIQNSSEQNYCNKDLSEKQILEKKKKTFPLLLKNTLSFCCFCHTDPTFTYFRNCRDNRGSEHPCKAVFVLTHPAVQHQVVLQRGFDVSGLLWGGCKSLQSHKPGVYTRWQLASQLHKMSPRGAFRKYLKLCFIWLANFLTESLSPLLKNNHLDYEVLYILTKNSLFMWNHFCYKVMV